jgi:cellobiose-specific phosphotransferase system component IIB
MKRIMLLCCAMLFTTQFCTKAEKTTNAEETKVIVAKIALDENGNFKDCLNIALLTPEFLKKIGPNLSEKEAAMLKAILKAISNYWEDEAKKNAKP